MVWWDEIKINLRKTNIARLHEHANRTTQHGGGSIMLREWLILSKMDGGKSCHLLEAGKDSQWKFTFQQDNYINHRSQGSGAKSGPL